MTITLIDVVLCHLLIAINIYVSTVLQKIIGVYGKASKDDVIRLFWTICIYVPLVEESLFRFTLKYYLGSIPYASIINIGIFGLVHSSNIMELRKLPNLKLSKSKIYSIILWQCIFATYVGYIIIKSDNFTYGLCIHVYMNTMIAMGPQLIPYVFPTISLQSTNTQSTEEKCSVIYHYCNKTQDDNLHTKNRPSLFKTFGFRDSDLDDGMKTRYDQLHKHERAIMFKGSFNFWNMVKLKRRVRVKGE